MVKKSMQKKKVKKKLTLLIFDDNSYESVKTRKIQMSVVKTTMSIFAIFIILSVTSFYFLGKLFSERNLMLSYKQENQLLKHKIASYGKEVIDIQAKIAALDYLEKKVRTLSSYSERNDSSNLAIGGKEVDLLRDFSAVAARKEKQFFDELNNTLLSLGSELEKREMSLSELVDFLEEQRLLVLSTPSIWPVKGWLSSKFGYRISPFTGRRVFHEGIDVAARYGVPVIATGKGIVIYAGYKLGYGNLVTIDHGFGYVTRYGHNSKVLVKVGDRVEKGHNIAKVGNTGKSTGPHVHYEVLVNGIPVNPLKFIAAISEQK